MEEETIKKLSLAAAKKRLSPQTGFIHHWNEDPHHVRQDAISILENFIYAYALFRMKTVDQIQEGKALLEKLLAFEVEGNFPVYLHEFPACKDSRNSLQLIAPLTYLLKDFSLALGESLSVKLRSLLERIQKREPNSSLEPRSPDEWAKLCIDLQKTGKPFPQDKVLWNSTLGIFIGECKERWQEGYEPALTLLDFFMGTASKRALVDHPIHLKTALIQSWKQEKPKAQESSFIALVDEKQRQPLTFYWGGHERVHSLVLESKKGSWQIEALGNEWICKYTYDQDIPSEEDAMEWAFYLDDSDDHTLLIEEQKATLFHPGEEVTLLSNGTKISFRVEADLAQGLWTGHILKGDRLFQKSKQLAFGGYDWKLGWRTIRRQPNMTLTLYIKAQNC